MAFFTVLYQVQFQVTCGLASLEQEKLIKTGMVILDTRGKYEQWSLTELYDDITMPLELRKANDRAVWEAYGKAWDITSEEDCVAHLMKLYVEMTQ